jgi:3-deoxy-D-arabino-heptulosonate 7-phosphate (DAHP) synthase class II
MKTSLQIAEELFGTVTVEGWHARIGHAISEDKFKEVVQALDAARADGRDIQRELEVRMRQELASLLEAIHDERAELLKSVDTAKASFTEVEARLAAKVLEMREVLEEVI